MVKAYKIGIPSKEFLVMPLGYLADLTDASVILDGYADEYIEPEYINVDMILVQRFRLKVNPNLINPFLKLIRI